MGFKDQLNADLDAFINPDEFAETHIIDDGQPVNCVIENDIIQSPKSQEWGLGGIYINAQTLYIKASDLPDRPVKDQHLKIDDDLFLVLDCAEEAGMLKITLEANEA